MEEVSVSSTRVNFFFLLRGEGEGVCGGKVRRWGGRDSQRHKGGRLLPRFSLFFFSFSFFFLPFPNCAASVVK